MEGITEVTDVLARAREEKRVVALADGSMASLAYWIGSQAHALYVTPTSAVGSIGVYSVIVDTSQAAADVGAKVHMVKAGEHKGLGEPGVPVSEAQLAGVQENVDAYYALFTAAVSEGRGLSMKQTLKLADGRVHIGAGAVTNGLADRVASFAETIETLTEPPAQDLDGADALAALRSPGGPVTKTNEPQAAAAAITPDDEDTTMDPTDIIDQPPATVASLTLAYPELVAEIGAAAATAERERTAYIRAQALDFQTEKVEELVASGATQADALQALHTDLMENGQARAEALVTAEPLGLADDDPDGGAASGPHAFNESSKSWEDTEATGPDYAACTTEETVTEMATKEFQAFDTKRKSDLGGLKAFCALRRGEHNDRVVAAG